MPTNSPIFDQTRRFTIWEYDEIYTGPSGNGVFVPNVKDIVFKLTGNVLQKFVVSQVAQGSLLATLTQIYDANPADSVAITDPLLQGYRNIYQEVYRVYLDKSVVPFRLAVDARLNFSNPDASYVQIFEGTDISGVGKIISQTFDNSGVYTGNDLVLLTDVSGNSKIVPDCFTSADLQDGDVVTIVVRDSLGVVCYAKNLLVVNTGFIRKSSTLSKEVVSVSLVSPFLSGSVNNQINYPLNLPISLSNFVGVTTYSDGSQYRGPIDDVRFSVSGLDSYLASTVGQNFPIVVKYTLQANEHSYSLTNTQNGQISQTFNLVVSSSNPTYQVRLLAYPVWISPVGGYRLTWFLYDAARSTAIRVTDQVQLTQDSPPLNPTLYGARQTIKVKLDLSLINPSYNQFIYEQSVDIFLLAQGTYRQNASTPPNWQVNNPSGVSVMYGPGVFATFQAQGNGCQMSLRGIYSVYNDWLTAVYKRTNPIFIAPGELEAPEPTHFTLLFNNLSFTYPIEAWDSQITLATRPTNSDTIFLKFIFRTANVDLNLSVAGLPAYQVSANGGYL